MPSTLWRKWERHYIDMGLRPERICRDGIVDKAQWVSSEPKVLFVLKDVNDWEQGDIRNHLANGPKGSMWTLGRWAAGFMNGFPPYSQIDRRDVITEALRSIALINLKKASGGSSAWGSAINAYCYRDRELLREQIHHISPDVIIAGGVYDQIVWLLDVPVYPERPGADVLRDRTNSAWVIPWRHPNRANSRKTYDELRRLWKRHLAKVG